MRPPATTITTAINVYVLLAFIGLVVSVDDGIRKSIDSEPAYSIYYWTVSSEGEGRVTGGLRRTQTT